MTGRQLEIATAVLNDQNALNKARAEQQEQARREHVMQENLRRQHEIDRIRQESMLRQLEMDRLRPR